VAEEDVEADDFLGAKPVELPIGEGGGDFFLYAGEEGDIGLAGREDALVEGFELDGAEVADLGFELVIPVDEGLFRHLEVIGDAGEADALSAELDKAVFGFVSVHLVLLLVFHSHYSFYYTF
jgi:hypothetical protein